MYLKIKNGTQTTAYALYDTGPKPYLKVNKTKVLPLTTSTTTGLHFKAKLGTKIYRPLQSFQQTTSSTISTTTDQKYSDMTFDSATLIHSSSLRYIEQKESNATSAWPQHPAKFLSSGRITSTWESTIYRATASFFDTNSVSASFLQQSFSLFFEKVTNISTSEKTISIYFNTDKNYYPIDLTSPLTVQVTNSTILTKFFTTFWGPVTRGSVGGNVGSIFYSTTGFNGTNELYNKSGQFKFMLNATTSWRNTTTCNNVNEVRYTCYSNEDIYVVHYTGKISTITTTQLWQ